MDPALRTLKRALARGEPGAELELAKAHLRQGNPGAAAQVLGQRPLDALDAEAEDLLNSAWRQELGRLAPAASVPGLRPWGRRVAGWLNEGRLAVLGQGQTFVVDVTAGETVHEAFFARLRSPLLTLPEAGLVLALGKDPAPWAILRHLPGHATPWRAAAVSGLEDVPLPDELELEHTAIEAEPGGTRLRIGRLILELVTDQSGAGHAATVSTLGLGAWAVDWARQRVLRWQPERGLLSWSELPLELGTSRSLDVSRLFRRAEPIRAGAWQAPAPEHDPPWVAALPDGRAVVYPPLAIVEPEAGQATFPRLSDGLSGPVRLQSGGRLLLFRGGRPARALAHNALGAARQSASARLGPAPRRIGGACWHPRTAVAACPASESWQEPAQRDDSGAALLSLPRGSRPLGWSPDGRTLLVLNEIAGERGRLEAWRPDGAAA